MNRTTVIVVTADTAKKTVDQTGVRTRAMERKLRSVEKLPDDETDRLLELPAGEEAMEPAEMDE